MAKKPFFTPEFYSDPFLTKNVINELLDRENPVTIDYHFSKALPVDHLTFDWSIKIVKDQLSKLISDPQAYLIFQKETHWDPIEDEMPLNALLMEFSLHYTESIRWGKTSNEVRLLRKTKIRQEVHND